MTNKEISDMLEEAMSTGDVARRRKLLDALVQENPENADVQLAQAILGGLYSQGKGGATRNLERAAQLLENPARHGHPQALLQLALVSYQLRRPEAIRLFCRAWVAGGTSAEAAAAKLEELRRAGASKPAFLQIIDGEINGPLADLREEIRENADAGGSAQMALALYYIYELNGPQAGNLERAYDCLKEAQRAGNPLAAIYLERTAFAHMENPEASARLPDARTDYAPKPVWTEPAYPDGFPEDGGDRAAGQREDSLFQAANMPYAIYGPHNRVYHRISTGLRSADYICEKDSDWVTIRDEDISVGAAGYSATTSSGYFYW